MAISDRITSWFYPKWSFIDKLGKNRLLRSSYFWIVFIPLITNLLSRVCSVLTFEVFGQQITLTLKLPFTWQVLFFSAILATIANIFYVFCCPRFIKNYRNFADFQDQGKANKNLIQDLIEFLKHFEFQKAWKIADDFILKSFAQSEYGSFGRLGKDGSEGIVITFENQPPPKKDHRTIATELLNKLKHNTEQFDLRVAFWHLRDQANTKYNHNWKIGCTLFYYASILSVLWVMAENIFFTIKYIITN